MNLALTIGSFVPILIVKMVLLNASTQFISSIASPLPLSNTILYTALFKQKHDFNFLKIFGCACFPLLRPYTAHKFDFRSHECLFLGYSTSHKGYKCLSPTGRLYISKDVLFNESRFPYKYLFENALVPSSSLPISFTLQPIPLVSDKPLPNSFNSSPPVPPSLLSPTSLSHMPSPLSHLSLQPTQPSLSPSPSLNSPTSLASRTTIMSSTPSYVSLSSESPSLPLQTPNPANTHSMQTRLKDGIPLPKLHPSVFLTNIEPHTVKQALKDPKWLAAMQDEFSALERNKTWTLVPLPANRKAIGCKWVFRVKENADGSINKYKARLVAKGFHQLHVFDFHETFSPVIKPATIRLLLTLALTHKWSIQQLDINNAFLNGFLDEEVYMDQPPVFTSDNPSLVCKLNKALYGFKQAPRKWFERLRSTLLSLDFSNSKCDSSLFTYHSANCVVYLLVYVDDIIITGNSLALIKSITSKLHNAFALKQLGTLDYFLGIEVKCQPNGCLLLSQGKYIRDLLAKANMLGASPVYTPMVSTAKLTKTGSSSFSDPTLYRSVVGALQYVTITRPELSYSVNKVCQFMVHPLEAHWLAVKRILRYLAGTQDLGLHLFPAPSHVPFTLHGYCDADWAANPDDRRSTSGAAVFLGPNLQSWWSKKQTVVPRSSAEAEYRSLALVTAEILWLTTLLNELKVPFASPLIFCDNQSTIAMAHNPVLHARTKHMEIDLFFVREKVLAKQLDVVHIPGVD
ncbi:retrovirus-related Pol polyprotein from transposon TNT 1-94, partial [Trifolium medium]|nr:retrovirus-related Pol polyprotein from transposon TNT 1-94 [Trifolium medium]